MVKGSTLFDTSILINLLSDGNKAKLAIETQPPQNVISLIIWMEAMVGTKKYHQEVRTCVVLGAFNVIGVPQGTAERSVSIRQEHGVGSPGAIILATMQIHHLMLVTRNTKDFVGIPGVVMPYTL